MIGGLCIAFIIHLLGYYTQLDKYLSDLIRSIFTESLFSILLKEWFLHLVIIVMYAKIYFNLQTPDPEEWVEAIEASCAHT